MEDPRIISALFIFLKMAYYNVLINMKRRKSFHFQLNIWQFPFPIWSKENLLFHSWQLRRCMGS